MVRLADVEGEDVVRAEGAVEGFDVAAAEDAVDLVFVGDQGGGSTVEAPLLLAAILGQVT